jgi:RHS repeat-associated protein
MQPDVSYDCTLRFVHLCILNVSRYTGKERDSESGNDYFGARYYASSMGRFLSPDYQDTDDDDVPDAVPNGALSNPQTLNLYSYVLNNPLTRRDYDGHASWQDCNDGSGSQCWNGDYNGERDCSGSSGCLFWNSQSGQWQGTDPTAKPDPGLGDLPGIAFTGFTRLMLGDRYGFQQMGYAYARTFATPFGAGGLIPLPTGTPLGRPAIVPDGWKEQPSKKGGGTVYVDPNNPHNRVRVMPGDPNSSNPAQREPYMKVQVSGQFVDANGNQVQGSDPEAHIPVGTEMQSPFIP